MMQEQKEKAEAKLKIIEELLEKYEEYKKIDLRIDEPKINIKADLLEAKKSLELTIASNTELTL